MIMMMMMMTSVAVPFCEVNVHGGNIAWWGVHCMLWISASDGLIILCLDTDVFVGET